MEKSYTYSLPMDPASVQNRRQREEERIRSINAGLQEQEPLLKALRAAGERIRHVSELLERSAPYPHLIPILIDHVSKAYSPGLVAKIGRTLAVKEARPYWEDLVRLYKSAPVEPGLREGAKWSLHLALAEVADKAVLSDLIALTLDQRNGPDRLMFPRVLWKFRKDARALRAIEQLLSDPNLGPEASRLLRKKPIKADRTA